MSAKSMPEQDFNGDCTEGLRIIQDIVVIPDDLRDFLDQRVAPTVGWQSPEILDLWGCSLDLVGKPRIQFL